MSEEPEWDDEIIIAIRKYALQNAIEYDGNGQSSSVLGRFLSERADLRTRAKDVKILVDDAVSSANSLAGEMGIDYIKEQLQQIAPEALNREKQKRLVGLKPLQGDVSSIVLRFAPNPNGPLSLGHSRGIVINSEYAKMYEGKMVLRLDDTDTKIKPPLTEAYSWIEEDYEWLAGRPADVVIRASERMPVYLSYAEKMISDGFGYVCRCVADEFREFRKRKENCPCRRKRREENLSDWRMMNDGEIGEGGAVVRVKTEMTLPNPALRDWPALRIQHSPHPLVGGKYKVWPLLDFQSAIEDHEQGVTHIIRGKDLMDSTRKQVLLYEHFGWKYPETLYWGRVKIHGYGGFSTSSMRSSIENGKFDGWDDLRLPTIKSLRNRGFGSKSLRDFWIELGLNQKDISVPIQTLESLNSGIIDSSTERRSFVFQPKELRMKGDFDNFHLSIPRHPEGRISGNREWEIRESVFIQASDFNNKVVRLKEFADISIDGENFVIESEERSDDRSIIHWIPKELARPAKLLVPEGDEIIVRDGLIEDFELEIGTIYQLERTCFAKLEDILEELAIFLWLHD